MLNLTGWAGNGTFKVFAQVTTTAVPPEYDHQSPGDVILGLGGFAVDLFPQVAQIFNVRITAPHVFIGQGPIDFSGIGFSVQYIMPGSIVRAGAIQNTFQLGNPNVLNGVGLAASSGPPAWSQPVEVVRGSYSTPGLLAIMPPSKFQISFIYGQPSGWTDPAKVGWLVGTLPATVIPLIG